MPNCCRLRSRILGGVKNSFDIRRTGEHRLKVNKVRHKEIKMYTYCIKPLVISQECKLLPLIKNYHSGQYLFVHVMIYCFDYLLCKSSSLRVENSIPLFAYTASQSIHNTVAFQVPLFRGFSRQEHWNGFPFPPPGDIPNPGTCVSWIGRLTLYL